MALLRNNLSLKMKGRAGAYTFYSSKGRQVARVSQNSSNYGESARRSLAQQTRRVKWANLVNFWKLTSGVLRGSFETKRTNETDYNAFMRKNLAINTVALTKDMAARGCSCVDSFIISEGTLRPIAYAFGTESEVNDIITDLACDAGDEGAYETIGDLANSLISTDPRINAGTQITIVTVELQDHPYGPTSEFTAYEVTMDPEDTRTIESIFGVMEFSPNTAHKLKISDVDGVTGIAVLISDSKSGNLKVSTAELVCKSNNIVSKYSSDAAVAAAIESYGLDPDRFLDSGDYQG